MQQFLAQVGELHGAELTTVGNWGCQRRPLHPFLGNYPLSPR